MNLKKNVLPTNIYLHNKCPSRERVKTNSRLTHECDKIALEEAQLILSRAQISEKCSCK